MNQNEWSNVWRMIRGATTAPAPDITFDTRAVLVVFQGQKPSGGYSISIAEIRRQGLELLVRAEEHVPSRTDITTQALTSPFVAVSIPRPLEGTTVKFADSVDNIRQNLPPPQKPFRKRRGYRRRG
jgi:hypothetical protein